MTLQLTDDQSTNVKKLTHQPFPTEGRDELPMVVDSLHFTVYKDYLYVEDSGSGFVIQVYNADGKQVKKIRLDIPPVKVTEQDKTILLERLKYDVYGKMQAQQAGGWDNYMKKTKFNYPVSFPAIKDLLVVDDKIYVSTFKTKGGNERFIVLDLEGKQLDSHYLPIPQQPSFMAQASGRDNRFYAIADGKYYYINENEETDAHEVHVVDIR